MPAPTGAHGNCIYGQLRASTRPGKRAASPRAGRTGAASPLRDVCPCPRLPRAPVAEPRMVPMSPRSLGGEWIQQRCARRGMLMVTRQLGTNETQSNGSSRLIN